MDLQFPPFWIKFSNYRHQCAPPWDALAVDASILITQPRPFDCKIDWVLTNRAVAVITFLPQGLQGSANLAFNSRYHTQTALDDIAEAERSSRTTSFITSICFSSGLGFCANSEKFLSDTQLSGCKAESPPTSTDAHQKLFCPESTEGSIFSMKRAPQFPQQSCWGE